MTYPENPILTAVRRGGVVESVHRGAWVQVMTGGDVLAGLGDPSQLIFPRSATKSFQAIPLVESGAADRFRFRDKDLALAISSHSGEAQHVQGVEEMLQAIDLSASDLLCGPQGPRVEDLNRPATRVLNNCSGKHVGFLATCLQLGADPTTYLDPDGAVQQAVALAMGDFARTSEVTVAVDGCGAPTFRLPLVSLATAIASMASPVDLPEPRRSACRRLVAAAAAFPNLVGGVADRFDSDLMRVTKGRLFAKIGAEAVFVIGDTDAGTGLAIKVDDGSDRGLHFYLTKLLLDLGMIHQTEHDALSQWSDPAVRNWDGQIVGEMAVTNLH